MEISRRQVLQGIFWGRRGVLYLLAISVMGVIGKYDDVRSVITFLPEPSSMFSAVPSLVWFILGLLVVALLVFEGSYQYIRLIPKSTPQSDRLVELKYQERREVRDKERQYRGEIYGDVSLLLKQSREMIVPTAMTADISSIPQEKVDEVIQNIIKDYFESNKYRSLDFTQGELQSYICRALEVRHIGINWLRDNKPEVDQAIRGLDDKCSNVRHSYLRTSIAEFRDLIIIHACMELFARYLKSHDNVTIAVVVLKGREYWGNELDKLQVRINEAIDRLLRLEDMK